MKGLCWALIVAGVFLRLHHYLSDRSFWVDEASVAMEIRQYSVPELLQIGGFDYSEVRPGAYGFLLIEKAMFELLGDKEWVWRLFPFMCGIAALFLFWRITFAWTGARAGTVSLGLFVFSPSLIYYAAEAKPYSCEVFFVLLAYCLLLYNRRESVKTGGCVVSAIGGALLIWTSFAACFVLAAGLGIITTEKLWKRQWKAFFRVAGLGLFYLIHFGTYYLFSLRYFVNETGLVNYWKDSLLPVDATPAGCLSWISARGYDFLVFPGDLGIPVLGALFLVLGLMALHKKDKGLLMLLAGPAVLTLLAACWRKYPFAGRAVLFLTPMLYMMIGQGWGFLFSRGKKTWTPVVSVTLWGGIVPPGMGRG